MRRAWGALVGILVGAGVLSACPQAGHRCQTDPQCNDGEHEGVCAAGGHCAFPDEACPSGLVYGELVDPDLAGECVPLGDGTGTAGSGSSSSSSSGDEVASSDGSVPTGDDTAGSSCPAGAGGPCQPDDPCAAAGICNDMGECIPTESITCDEPPGPCHAAIGQCEPVVGCTYPMVPLGMPCDDGDPCTEDSTCDDAGTCVDGTPCTSEDPCVVAECTPEGCVLQPTADGAQCGMLESERCCNGTCVDISSDDAHCGGCNSPCAAGQPCESIAETQFCELDPANTSGRCRCSANADCPLGQLCHTQFPHPGRCAPSDAGDCDGSFVEVPLCPNYCSY